MFEGHTEKQRERELSDWFFSCALFSLHVCIYSFLSKRKKSSRAHLIVSFGKKCVPWCGIFIVLKISTD